MRVILFNLVVLVVEVLCVQSPSVSDPSSNVIVARGPLQLRNSAESQLRRLLPYCQLHLLGDGIAFWRGHTTTMSAPNQEKSTFTTLTHRQAVVRTVNHVYAAMVATVIAA